MTLALDVIPTHTQATLSTLKRVADALPKHGPLVLIMMAAIQDYAEGWVYPMEVTSRSGMSAATIRTAMNQLWALGYLDRQTGPRGTHMYKLGPKVTR